MAEYRRILLDGAAVQARRDGEDLIAADGRRVSAAEAVHLPPVTPSKIIAVHLNHLSRVTEFQAKLPPAPTYFTKPVSALVAHGGGDQVLAVAAGLDGRAVQQDPAVFGHRSLLSRGGTSPRLCGPNQPPAIPPRTSPRPAGRTIGAPARCPPSSRSR